MKPHTPQSKGWEKHGKTRRSPQRFTDSRLRSENREAWHGKWTQRLSFPRRSEHFLHSYLPFHTNLDQKKSASEPKSTSSRIFRLLLLRLPSLRLPNHRTTLVNTDTKTPNSSHKQHLPHNLHFNFHPFSHVFTCQVVEVVDCHGHWRYAQCQGRVQDLQAEARHGNNMPRAMVQQGWDLLRSRH